MLRKYERSNGDIAYEYNGRLLDLPLKSEQLKYVVRELEHRNEKDKEYTFGNYFNIAPLAFFFFSLSLTIFCLLSLAYSFDLFVPNLIQGYKKFEFDTAVNIFNFIILGIICISVVLTFFIVNDYNNIKKNHDETRLHNEKILPYFKTKLKEIEYIEEYKLDNNVLLDDWPKFQYYDIDENVLNNCLIIVNSITTAFFLFCFLFIFDNIKVIEGEGTFDTIHYMDNSYTIFYKEYGQMKKMTFPRNIDFNIKINKEETERKYSYYWLVLNGNLLNDVVLNRRYKNQNQYKKHQPRVDIYINKDDYIKGSLLNK